MWPQNYDFIATEGNQDSGRVQLDSNLFANNPSLLPPGTTL
jgi:hypothetical protein